MTGEPVLCYVHHDICGRGEEVLVKPCEEKRVIGPIVDTRGKCTVYADMLGEIVVVRDVPGELGKELEIYQLQHGISLVVQGVGSHAVITYVSDEFELVAW